MPVYEYACADCGKHFEELQKVSDKPLKTCKNCGGKLQRLISQTSFALKGGGWYKDGYSSTKGPAAKGTGKDKSGTPAKDSGKTAAKASSQDGS
ncbi:MAG: zinc ribbon domain-containing protein [bacterium]